MCLVYLLDRCAQCEDDVLNVSGTLTSSVHGSLDGEGIMYCGCERFIDW